MTESEAPRRIAMWSGPRNLSTALMRSFGARADCAAWDEPFYPAFLAASGIDHPLREEVVAAGETDPEVIAAGCLGPVPGGAAVFYQKHMAHHMLDGFPLDWTDGVRNAFLIRDPLQVATSYERKRERPEPSDLGFERLLELFEREAQRLGKAPPVVDATRLASAPEAVLRRLCQALGLAFDPAMLRWDPGPRPEDGLWAKHWYGAVWRSTGFEPPRPAPVEVSDWARRLAEIGRPSYETLAAVAL